MTNRLYGKHRRICRGSCGSTHIAWKRALVHTMDTYAQLGCRQICRAMLQKLPREIRDQIYLYVHGEQVTYIAPGNRGRGPPRFLRDVEDLLQTANSMRAFFDHSPFLAYCRSKDLTTAHYFDRKYLGRTTQKEIVQSWFRTGVFQIGDARVVREFLGREWKPFGVRPKDHMCRIELSAYDPSEPLYDADKTRPIDTNTLLVEFMALPPTDRTNITVVCRIEPDFFIPVETRNFGKMMRQIYEARARGHRVLKVSLKSHGGIQFGVPVAEGVESDDWFWRMISNLQRASSEFFEGRE